MRQLHCNSTDEVSPWQQAHDHLGFVASADHGHTRHNAGVRSVLVKENLKHSVILMPPSPTAISVLGGGLTGLSSAFHLSRRFPAARITLLEKSPRAGGWVYSERVNVQDDHGHTARILLERGPRTLRPNGKATLEMVCLS